MEYKRKRLIRAALQKAETKRKQTVRQAESAADTEQQTPEEYAQTVVSEKTAQAAENLQSKALDTGRISYRQFRILHSAHHRKQQIGGRAGESVPLYAGPAGHFAPAAIRGNAPQPACPVRWDRRCGRRIVLAAAGTHLYILPLRGGGRLR